MYQNRAAKIILQEEQKVKANRKTLKSFFFLTFLVVFVVLSAGCEQADDYDGLAADIENQVEKFSEQAGRYADKAYRSTRQAAGKVPDLAEEEYEKLFRIDYKIFNIPLDHNLELNLNALGKERWECFHIAEGEDSYQLSCRRRPKSYLKYLKGFVGFF